MAQKRLSYDFQAPPMKRQEHVRRTPFSLRTVSKESKLLYADVKKRVGREIANKWKEDLQALMSRTWKINYGSKLADFNLVNKNINKGYRDTLSYLIGKEIPSMKLTVQFDTSSCFSLDDKVDFAIITVNSEILVENEEHEKTFTIYQAWLLLQNYEPGSSRSSYLILHSGQENVHNIVIDWLQTSFSCYIARQGLTQLTLIWMSGVWSSCPCLNVNHSSSSESKVSFFYAFSPPEALVSSNKDAKILRFSSHIQFLAREIAAIWNDIVNSEDQFLNETDVQRYHIFMNKMVENLTAVPSNFMKLDKFSSPCFSISINGKIRFYCRNAAHLVIKQLIEIHDKT